MSGIFRKQEAEPLELSANEFDGGAQIRSPSSSRPDNNTNHDGNSDSNNKDDNRYMRKYNKRQQEAMREAEQVIMASNMEGFNLLGVVANPRFGSGKRTNSMVSSSSSSIMTTMMSSMTISSTTAPSSSSTTTNTPASPSAASSMTNTAASFLPTSNENGSGLEEAVSALESTLADFTTKIDAINSVFEEWSRQYLGTFEDGQSTLLEYSPPSELESVLQKLPPELENLSLETLQAYLNHNGVLGHGFDTRGKQAIQLQEQHRWHESIAPDSDLGDLEENEVDFMESLTQLIPNQFFETYFDLTDEATFQELLVGKDDDADCTAASAAAAAASTSTAVDVEESLTGDYKKEDLSHLPEALIIPTRQILRLPPPDSFTGFLDKVELALLQQVRSKSIAFFHETNRFGQLKEWIAGLVEEVQRVRKLLNFVQQKSVVAWELIPLLDKQRQDLTELSAMMESAANVIECKASISGLLSAQQDLSAAQQIQHGRSLLKEVDKLVALSSAEDQFRQYETLVIANLGEELVEALLDWKSFGKSSRLVEMVQGLTLCDALGRISRLYSNRLLDVIRMTVRTTVGEFAEEADSSVKACVTGMTFDTFMDCLDMLFEQLLDTLKGSVGVQGFGKEEGVDLDSVQPAAELSSKSISELLRLRKEAHSLVTLEEMKKLWDVSLNFTNELERLSGYKATGLRSTLLAQAKAFVERQHESSMSALVAALDSERWTQCDVSAERQAALTRLCSGRAVTSRVGGTISPEATEKKPDAEVEGIRYKVVWSSLLLVEMIMTNIGCAAHFQSLATNVVGKVAELLRLFNSRSTSLVLGAGAINSAARLKSINAKHLSLVTQCLGMTIAILPHVRAALMAQLPSKQHTLLSDLDKIKKEYAEHNEKVLTKFVTIIGGIVEHGLAPRIASCKFDDRVGKENCCFFLDGVSTNTRKMHQVLRSLLPPDHLQDVFSRIFAYLDGKLPALFDAAAGQKNSKGELFSYPNTDEGKRQMLQEMERTTESLNGLQGVRPWEFQAIRVLERKLDVTLQPQPVETEPEPETDPQTEQKTETTEAESEPAEGAPDEDGAQDPEEETSPKGSNGGQHDRSAMNGTQSNGKDHLENDGNDEKGGSIPMNGKASSEELAGGTNNGAGPL